jgi:hypothetical protein
MGCYISTNGTFIAYYLGMRPAEEIYIISYTLTSTESSLDSSRPITPLDAPYRRVNATLSLWDTTR